MSTTTSTGWRADVVAAGWLPRSDPSGSPPQAETSGAAAPTAPSGLRKNHRGRPLACRRCGDGRGDSVNAPLLPAGRR